MEKTTKTQDCPTQLCIIPEVPKNNEKNGKKEPEPISTRIKVLRQAKRMSQCEFAKMVGISQSMISSFEIGRRKPNNAVILHISEIMGCSYEWLKTGETDEKVSPDEQIRKNQLNQIVNLCKKMNQRTLNLACKEMELLYSVQIEEDSKNFLNE